MALENAGKRDPARGPQAAREARGRILVEQEGRRRPFMRGIMVHTLMARGVSFEDAYRTANDVRDRIRGRDVVAQDEIATIVRDVLGEDPFEREPTRPLPADIQVMGGGRTMPFSKGILSQSLLAAAVDPNDAFDVAREIETELRERAVKEVDRRELRRVAYEAVTRHLGEQVGERYLVWRRFQEPERPVMILLGGAPGVGKTSLALEVAHRLGIGRVLSTDSIRQIMRIMLSSDLVPAIHGSSYDAQGLLSPDALVDDPVIEGFRAQSAIVSVGVRATMDRAVRESASLVLDGVSIVPGMLDLSSYEGEAEVIFMIVSTLDEDTFRDRFASRAEGQQQRATRRYVENLDGILRIQDHLLEQADRHHVPIVDNVSFESTVLLIIRHVAETLRKKGDFDAAEFP